MSATFSKYSETVGDALAIVPHEDVVVHPHIVNDVGAWGAGFVIAVTRKWPQPEQQFRAAGHMALGTSQLVQVGPLQYVYNMCAQHQTLATNPMPIDYQGLRQCIEDLDRMAHSYLAPKHQLPIEVHAPKFGTGLARGDWGRIRKMVQQYWCSPQSAISWTFVYDYK